MSNTNHVERPTSLPEDRPRSLLMIGYNTIDEAYKKGIIREDIPDSTNLSLNFGSYFDQVHLFIPFGRSHIERKLSSSITYHERDFKYRQSHLRLFRATLYLFYSARELQRLTKIIRPDVIQVCGPHIPNIVYMISGLWLFYPSTLFIEAFWEDILPAQTTIPNLFKKILPWYYSFSYKFYKVIFGAPSLDGNYYAKRGMNKQRISSWLQPVDIRLIDSAKQIIPPEKVTRLSSPIIVTVGRLHEEKCSIDTIEILKLIRDKGINASLVLIGDGPQRAHIEETVKNYNLQDYVYITGQISIVDGFAIVWRSDIYFAPMQGSALLEALSTGIPVVAYDHETHRALIHHGNNGILTPHRNTDIAASAIINLIQNPVDAQQLGKNARKNCELILDPLQMACKVNDGAYQAYKKWKN